MKLKISIFFVFLSALLFVSTASAWLKQGVMLCNGTNESINAAVGVIEDESKRSLGWLELTAQECLPIYKKDISGMDLFYVYAKGEEKIWSSNSTKGEAFCMQSEEDFDLVYPDCQDDGIAQVFYMPVKVDGRKLVEYTFK